MKIDFNKIDNYFFIGIGGMGMSSLAKYFICNGKRVAGYDRNDSILTDDLNKVGADILFEDDIITIPKYIRENKDKTLVVYTAAISNDNSILRYFIDNKYLVLKRAVVLGELTSQKCLAISGSHGKSTVTALLTYFMNALDLKFTSFMGAISNDIKSNFYYCDESLFIVEADEFDKSFLSLHPKSICITSIDYDHGDIYDNYSDIMQSFKKFSNKVNHKNLIFKKGLPFKGTSYGLEEDADIIADNIKLFEGYSIFDLILDKKRIKDIKINLPNSYNINNTLATIGMVYLHGISLDRIREKLAALANFKGVYRRFEYKINNNKIIFIDDYAHHPTEITNILNNLRAIYPNKKILCVFQPHLFSRTLDLMDDFANALSNFDFLILLDIYPAREKPIKGVNSQNLLKKINVNKKIYSSKENLILNIKRYKFDIIISMGAGDIEYLVNKIKIELLKNA